MFTPTTLRHVIVFTLLLLTVASVRAEDEKPRLRRVVVEPIQFQMDVPASWQITLNERLRGKAFLKAQGTTLDGKVIPASLSVIYMRPEKGETFPKFPEPEAYATVFTTMLEANEVSFELLRSANCKIDGYSGVLVEYKQFQGDLTFRTTQMNVIPPDGMDRYIVTYTTFEEHVAVDFPYMQKLIDGIRLGKKQEKE